VISRRVKNLMPRKSKEFLRRSAAARKGARTRKANAAIVKKMYAQLLRIERKERKRTGERITEEEVSGDVWEIEIGMVYGD
jgi:hypothetical protein